MRKHVDNVTPEEITAMHDRNEDFIGTHANFQKMALYREIQADLTEFLRKSPDAIKIGGYPPNVHEKNAIQWIDFIRPMMFDKDETTDMTAILRKVDGFTVSSNDKRIRFCFNINDIWFDD